MNKAKIKATALSSIAFGLGVTALFFIYHFFMQAETGYSFVLPPMSYVSTFAANVFLLFVIQCMTASIKFERSRKHALLPVRLAAVRIILIAIAWFVILLVMGVWVKFVGLGRSIFFFIAVIESAYFSVIKIWNFGR